MLNARHIPGLSFEQTKTNVTKLRTLINAVCYAKLLHRKPGQIELIGRLRAKELSLELRCDVVKYVVRRFPTNVNLLRKSQALKLECWTSVWIVSSCTIPYAYGSVLVVFSFAFGHGMHKQWTNKICLHKSGK